ncbi:hypothetical protein [Actinocorallia sp. A-T 12471]|uniref:hypothetical protein n=1 Tax=Actinocorallia sp. A-T 12471 TaxID=3089813 RepID=UPI0029D00948|nr:hypothetical protein [Actinocorallia sp. A-T 12471]MDX6743759.1 hypothetical protein [Actinocorallia sp. A-T 12471]
MLDLRLRDTLDTTQLLAARRGLVGRDAELRELAGLLPAYGALTLAGPAGMGKSALARGLAALLGPRYPDGCAFADCAALPADATSAAAADLLLGALRLERGPSGPLAALLGAVRERRALLVLDHVGQLTAGARHVIEDVMRTIAEAGGEAAHAVVVTRDPLGTPAERVWQVPPLTTEAALRLLHPRHTPTLLPPPTPKHAKPPNNPTNPNTHTDLPHTRGDKRTGVRADLARARGDKDAGDPGVRAELARAWRGEGAGDPGVRADLARARGGEGAGELDVHAELARTRGDKGAGEPGVRAELARAWGGEGAGELDVRAELARARDGEGAGEPGVRADLARARGGEGAGEVDVRAEVAHAWGGVGAGESGVRAELVRARGGEGAGESGGRAELVRGRGGVGEVDVRAEVAELLGGVPLALELGGVMLGRVPALRLRDHLRRRRDLHAAFGLPWASGERVADWVADLLPAREAVLLGRMAVFPGPAGTDAVAAVCGHAPLSAGEVPELLESLTAAGLVTEAGTLRPGLAESCAARCEDPALLRDRLLAYCLLTALEGRRAVPSDTLAALRWALRPDAGPASVRAAAELLDAAGEDLTDDTGPAEALAWTLRALHHTSGLPRHEAGLLHARAGALKARMGDDVEARAHYETALGLFGVEPRGLRRRAEVLGRLVGLDLLSAHPSTAALIAGAAAEARASGDPRAVTAVLPSLALALSCLGRGDDALALLAEAEAAGPLPCPDEAAFVHLRAGDPVECLARTAPLTARGGLVGARALLARGWARMVGGDLAEAAETLARGEELAAGSGAPGVLATFDEAFAHAARLSGDAPSAARRTARMLRRAVDRRDALTGVRAGCLALVLHGDTHPEAERIAEIVRECRLRTGLPAWPFPDAEIAELEESLGATATPPSGWYPDTVPALLAELLTLLET